MSSENEYLTTDASPKPPRNDKVNEDILNEDKSQGQTLTDTDIKEESHTTKRTTSKTKKICNQAYANVINISNSNGIHIGSNITITHNNSKEKNNCTNIPKTKAIEVILNSKEVATIKDIMFISNNIGEGWRNLIRMLDYIDAQIDQFYETHLNKGVKEVIYQILLDWLQNEANNATIGRLANALWSSNHKEVVQQMTIKST